MKKLIMLLIIAMIMGRSAMAERDYFAELRRLGIEISDGAEEYVRSEMESYKNYGFSDKAQMDNYMMVLFLLGMGKYNYEDNSIMPITDSVYAFDMEMTWVNEGYELVLDAVKRLSGGNVDIRNINIVIDDATAEAGWGTIPITFEMNGELCSYTARLDTDWMDPGFLDFINEKVKGIGDDRQLWFATDNGQGLVMFYRDKAWVNQFSAATGIVFFDSMTDEMSIDPLSLLKDWLL